MHIDQSDAVLVVVTDKYLSSYNCRRELAAAMRCKHLGKPLILLLESDETKGATSVTRLRAELADVKLSGKFGGTTSQQEEAGRQQLQAAERFIRAIEVAPPGVTVVRYHREKHLRLAALKTIAATIYRENRELHLAASTDSRSHSNGDSMPKPAEWTPLQTLHTLRLHNEEEPPTLRKHAAVYMNTRYRSVRRPDSATSYFDEVEAALSLYGIRVVEQPLDVLPIVVLLCPDAFADTRITWMIRHTFQKRSETNKRFSRRSTDHAGTNVEAPPVLALYCTSVPFAFYLDSCPSDLKELGMFRLLFNKWPDGELLQVATACIVAKSIQGHLTAHGAAIDVAFQWLESGGQISEVDGWQSESPRSSCRLSGIADDIDGEAQPSSPSTGGNRQSCSFDHVEPARLPAPGNFSPAQPLPLEHRNGPAGSPGGRIRRRVDVAGKAHSHLDSSTRRSHLGDHTHECNDSSMREGPPTHRGISSAERGGATTRRSTLKSAMQAQVGTAARHQVGTATRRRSLTWLKEVVASRRARGETPLPPSPDLAGHLANTPSEQIEQ